MPAPFLPHAQLLRQHHAVSEAVPFEHHINFCGAEWAYSPTWMEFLMLYHRWVESTLSLTSLMCKHTHIRFFYLSVGYNNQNLAVPPKQGERTTQSGFLSWSSINALYHQGSGTSVVLCLQQQGVARRTKSVPLNSVTRTCRQAGIPQTDNSAISVE